MGLGTIMYCQNCGAWMSDDSQFCMKCGAKVTDLEETTAPSEPTPEPTAEKTVAAAPVAVASVTKPASQQKSVQQGRNDSQVAIIACLSVLVVALVAVLVYTQLLANPNSSGSTTSTSASSTVSTTSSNSDSKGKSGTTIGTTTPTDTKTTTTTDTKSTSETSTSSDYVLPDSDTHLYTRDELESLSDQQLFYARNEIYARHGRGFDSDELQTYFDSKSWYTRQYDPADFPDSLLNSTEKANAGLILEVEKDRNSPYVQ